MTNQFNSNENETLCLNCMEQGTLNHECKNIEYFRNIKISHFQCPYCNYSNDTIAFPGKVQQHGIRITYHISSFNDLQRFIIKSCSCTLSIPQLKLEIPGPTQAYSYQTIDNFLSKSYAALNDIENKDFLEQFAKCIKGSAEFDIILDDPSGNSFIECPNSPENDDKIEITYYERTKENEESIEINEKRNQENYEIGHESFDRIDSIFANNDGQVMGFQTTCAVCETEGTMRSCTLVIPHFKEIAIMTFNCDHCGYHKAEVIVCGTVSPKARSISLHCDSKEDLKRELLKSETAKIKIPEIDFELTSGTLGGKFTTVEGLLVEIQKNLRDNNPFTTSYADVGDLSIYNYLIQTLEDFSNNEEPFTIIIDDPLANSYIEEIKRNDKIIIENYDRSADDNDYLGINDMKTEEYIIGNISTYTSP
ncbi:nucleolar zinc-finger protein [Tritrichomonas musculus]|uniref:Nucleolar zinc-finger protein n=1 Tax=Tritrichomonas musculus TaxID=1915356 RepID=A0ABR2GQC5_9EUKA